MMLKTQSHGRSVIRLFIRRRSRLRWMFVESILGSSSGYTQGGIKGELMVMGFSVIASVFRSYLHRPRFRLPTSGLRKPIVGCRVDIQSGSICGIGHFAGESLGAAMSQRLSLRVPLQ